MAAQLAGADWLDTATMGRAVPIPPAANPLWALALASYQRGMDEDRQQILAALRPGRMLASR